MLKSYLQFNCKKSATKLSRIIKFVNWKLWDNCTYAGFWQLGQEGNEKTASFYVPISIFHLFLKQPSNITPPSHTSTFPDLLAALSLSATWLASLVLMFLILKPCRSSTSLGFQCCYYSAAFKGCLSYCQLAASLFWVQMYLLCSQCKIARQRNIESLINVCGVFFHGHPTEKGEAQDLSFATIKITQWCGTFTWFKQISL